MTQQRTLYAKVMAQQPEELSFCFIIAVCQRLVCLHPQRRGLLRQDSARCLPAVHPQRFIEQLPQLLGAGCTRALHVPRLQQLLPMLDQLLAC